MMPWRRNGIFPYPGGERYLRTRCDFGEGSHDFVDLADEKKCALCVL